ncbi:uncharacterized protein LOC120320757 [Drosophila yakuba]|uniref:uncharacterized protein LOC120320757 n=1 Tax=Drosophila yakuba TaxID=7245 RepID=UPI00193089BE|nr:uncharacterized protein LOC120320757 [Drosophila yakuba]
MGTARTITSFMTIKHLIHLEEYEVTTDKLHELITNLPDLPNIVEIRTLLLRKLNQVEQKLTSQLPSESNSRPRRGLINGLGTIIKTISGNMDATDEEKIISELKQLGRNAENTAQFQNETLIRFMEITDHINKEQEVINNFINFNQNRISKEIDTGLKKAELNIFLTRININLDLLYTHLAGIAESLLFAKLNIVPKYILDNAEIQKIKMSLTDQNVKIKEDYEVYNLLSLETSTEKKTIVFEIKIPILSPNNYTLYQIVTIPFNGTEIVNLPKFILEDRIELKTLNTNCIRVNDLSVCETPTDPDNPECIHNLLANKTATCTVVETITQTRIYSPIEGLLVILNARDVNMTSDCIPSKSLSGSFIINHDSCSITINGTKYADATVIMTDRWQMDITKTT